MRALELVLRHKAYRRKREPVEHTQKSTVSMESLPNELIDQIIRHLDPPSAVCLALSSHRLHYCVVNFTGCRRLDDICPKDYHQLSTPLLQLYYLNRRLPHYRNVANVIKYADEFGISRRYCNPAYIQLLLCLRGFMAPNYVFCFASATVRYVPRKGKHVCGACQSERRYLAHKDLHEFCEGITR
jgi:hypothetical protein